MLSLFWLIDENLRQYQLWVVVPDCILFLANLWNLREVISLLKLDDACSLETGRVLKLIPHPLDVVCDLDELVQSACIVCTLQCLLGVARGSFGWIGLWYLFGLLNVLQWKVYLNLFDGVKLKWLQTVGHRLARGGETIEVGRQEDLLFFLGVLLDV